MDSYELRDERRAERNSL